MVQTFTTSLLLRKVIVFAFVLLSSLASTAQIYNGNASNIGNSCIELTSDNMWQVGTVFFPDTLNLNRPFSFLIDMYFGSKDANGADGMVFILQNNNPTQIGAAGGSLGWFGIPNSLGIEFDTYENPPESDPVDDHIAIFRDGNIDHNFPQNLAGPVSADPNGADIEDGQYHLVQIKWNPANFRLQVYFDCNFRLSYTVDLVNDIFNGDNTVLWGFSAASGGAFNQHIACILRPEGGNADSLELCQGETTLLIAPPSQDGIYFWEPNIQLSSNSQQSVEASPTTTTLYTVSYDDQCGVPTIDTFLVTVNELLGIDFGQDTSLCEGESVTLNPGIPSGSFNWSDGSTGDTLTVDTTGFYFVEVTDSNGCIYRDTQGVSFVDLPTVAANADTTICGFDSIYTLSVLEELPLTEYVWSTGDTAPQINIEESGSYIVEAINSCSTATDTVNIVFYKYEEGYFIPNVFTPNGDSFNDQFLVENFRPEDFYLKIFDRWGQQLFDTEDRSESWDGTWNGRVVQEGIYYYLVQTRDCKGEIVQKKGHLTLVK